MHDLPTPCYTSVLHYGGSEQLTPPPATALDCCVKSQFGAWQGFRSANLLAAKFWHAFSARVFSKIARTPRVKFALRPGPTPLTNSIISQDFPGRCGGGGGVDGDELTADTRQGRRTTFDFERHRQEKPIPHTSTRRRIINPTIEFVQTPLMRIIFTITPNHSPYCIVYRHTILLCHRV